MRTQRETWCIYNANPLWIFMDVRVTKGTGKNYKGRIWEQVCLCFCLFSWFFFLLPIADRSCLICQLAEGLSVEQRGGYLPSAVRLSVNDVIWVAFDSRNDTSSLPHRSDTKSFALQFLNVVPIHPVQLGYVIMHWQRGMLDVFKCDVVLLFFTAHDKGK